jgi:hypothetical protein
MRVCWKESAGRFTWRALDLAHVPMVYGRYVTVIPRDRDCVPTCCTDDATISGVALPVNAGSFLESPGFSGSHVSVYLTL